MRLGEKFLTKTKRITKKLIISVNGGIRPNTFNVLIPIDFLDNIAHEIVGGFIYDGKGYGVENIVGKVISAEVLPDGSIEYEAEITDEKVRKSLTRGHNKEYSIGSSNFI